MTSAPKIILSGMETLEKAGGESAELAARLRLWQQKRQDGDELTLDQALRVTPGLLTHDRNDLMVRAASCFPDLSCTAKAKQLRRRARDIKSGRAHPPYDEPTALIAEAIACGRFPESVRAIRDIIS